MEFNRPGQQGFSMMEVLIAMLVLSIGLLGLAALQAQGMRFNNEAYYRTQATQLGYQVIDMMRADRDNVASYRKSAADMANLDAADCDESGAASVGADVQLACWMGRLTGILPDAGASIVINAANNNYVDVTISWIDKELSSSTLATAKSQAACEARPNRTWDASGGIVGDTGVCRINQTWTVYP